MSHPVQLIFKDFVKDIHGEFFNYINRPDGLDIINECISQGVNFSKLLVSSPVSPSGKKYSNISPLKCISLMDPSDMRNQIAILLLKNGHNPDFSGTVADGFTPIFWAFLKGNFKLCKILKDHNANCLCFFQGKNCLDAAILSKDYKTIELALTFGLSNKKNELKQTALHIHATFALSINWLNIFKLLMTSMIRDANILSCPCTIMDEDKNGMTAIDYIWQQHLKKQFQVQPSFELIKYESHRSQFFFTDAEQYPILDKVFKLIREYQFEIHLAIFSQDYNIIELALARGCSNKKNKLGQTALHIHASFAPSINWFNIFKLLITSMIIDARVSLCTCTIMDEDKNGMTIIDYVWQKHLKIKLQASPPLKLIKYESYQSLFFFTEAEKYPILDKIFTLIRENQFGIHYMNSIPNCDSFPDFDQCQQNSNSAINQNILLDDEPLKVSSVNIISHCLASQTSSKKRKFSQEIQNLSDDGYRLIEKCKKKKIIRVV